MNPGALAFLVFGLVLAGIVIWLWESGSKS